ncbi:PNG1-protein with de-N-glycosylation function (N-glycanase) [Apiospora arundinis]|uniref:PNG1-protein with de-N-glycosylation function (N-glycanase) n=1 Tax=Apiospora arundinis TaxID=335852 RepID=A0ABR2HPJ1_9PEZI
MNQPAPTTKAWLYSESSTGQYLGSLRVSLVRRIDFWEAMGVARREFTEVIQPKLISYLRENSTEISTSTCMLNLSLFMMGKSSLKTKPTVMFVSEDKKVRKEALNLAKKSDILLEYPGFALGECKLIAEFAGQRQIGDHSDKLASPSGDTDDPLELFMDSTSCSAGARICAGQTDRVSTIGGLLIHGEAILGLTVCHILHSESTTDLAESEDSEDDCEFIGLDELDDDNEDDDERCIEFVDSTSQASRSPVASPTSCYSGPPSVSSFGFNDDIDSSFRSRAAGEDITEPCLTQPLAHTVNRRGEFTTKIGHVIFSSKPLDYCVFSIEFSHRPQPRENIRIDLGDLNASLEYGPRETKISVFNERAGEIRGTMKAFSSYCRFPSASDFQEVFIAQLDRPLVAGDCGSWVYDSQTNKLFGHVVAASVENTVITIMPARDVFKDILARFTSETTQKTRQYGAMQPYSNDTPMIPKSGTMSATNWSDDFQGIYAFLNTVPAPYDEARFNSWRDHSSLDPTAIYIGIAPSVPASIRGSSTGASTRDTSTISTAQKSVFSQGSQGLHSSNSTAASTVDSVFMAHTTIDAPCNPE